MCIGGTCRACGSDADCPPDDGHTCTSGGPRCVDRRCTYAIDEGACLIEGVCYAEGETHPDDGCLACAPATSPDTWTLRLGQSCEDGLFCTTGETCSSAGRCTGGSPRSCDDGLSCTRDSCDEAGDRCVNAASGGCAIDGACYAANARNPADNCLACVPATSTTGWTLAIGDACDDGRFCTVEDTCQVDGSCEGTPNPCSDGMSCTDDVCDVAGDACVHSVRDETGDGTPDYCAIASGPTSGTCYRDGESPATEPCQLCQPSVSTSTLQAAADETGCMAGATPGHCCSGTCQALNSRSHCGSCGTACSAAEMCGIFSMMPPTFMCCTICPPPP